MATVKKETKISQTRAADEANAVFHGINSDASIGEDLGLQLCQTYSAGPRKIILKELATLLSNKNAGVETISLCKFLKTQLDGVKQSQADGTLAAILRVATANDVEDDPRCACELILWMIESDKKLPKRLPIAKLPQGFTLAFEKLAARETVTRIMLKRWFVLALPFANCMEPDALKFSQLESTRILDAASKIEVSRLPDGFFASVPSLILLAKDGSGSFLASPIGRPFVPFFTSLKPTREKKMASDSEPTLEVVPSPKERLKSLLSSVTAIFEGLQSEFVLQENEWATTKIDLTQRIKQLERNVEDARSDLRTLKMRHKTELEAHKIEFERLSSEKAEVDEAARKLNADLKLTDENAAKDLVEQKYDLRKQISQIIDGPIHALVTDIQLAMKKKPADEDISNIADSFDSLHRKLIREIDLKNSARIKFQH